MMLRWPSARGTDGFGFAEQAHGNAVFLLEARGGEADGIEAAIKNDGRDRPIGVLEHIGDIVEPQIRNEFADGDAEMLFHRAGEVLAGAPCEGEHIFASVNKAALRAHPYA